MSKALVEYKNSSVEGLISQAIKSNLPPETMERFLLMRREARAEWAKSQFDYAMAEFQGECPVIVKSKPGGETNAGKVAYYYAPLDVIVSQTKALIQKHGFSYAIKSETTATGVKVKCIVKHSAGHSEDSEVDMPFGTKTNIMSETQKVAAAITFAKRYAFCNAFGILTGDEDTDSKTGKEKTPQPKMTNERLFELISGMIKQFTTQTDLMDLHEKIKKDKRLNKEQQTELLDKLSRKLDVIDNKK